MEKILLFGTFDLLHQGHKNFLRQAKEFGGYVIACLARDENIKKIKKHPPVYDERQRLRNLRQTGWCQRVILGDKKDYYKAIKKIKPSIICLGYDQKIFTKGLKQEIKKLGLKTKIIRLQSYHPQKYKSSILRKKYVGSKIYPGKRKNS